jgi:Uma2 family endonuclease
MTEPLVAARAEQPRSLAPPVGGWTVDDLEAWPETNVRYELTDGALTVSPSRSSVHEVLAAQLIVALGSRAPEHLAVTGAVDIHFTAQLTRRPDLLVLRSDEPKRHWFAPEEVVVAAEIESPGSRVEDRITKPAIYAEFGIPHYWRIEIDPPRVTIYRLGEGSDYRPVDAGDRLHVGEPFEVDLRLVDQLPRWAR